MVLTDDEWDQGFTGGKIFVNIRDSVGVKSAIKGPNGKPGVIATDMWTVVNYMRKQRRQ